MSEFTKEEVLALAEAYDRFADQCTSYNTPTARQHAQENRLAATALRAFAASMETEPAWYRYKLNPSDDWWSSGPRDPSLADFPRAIVEPLFAAPPHHATERVTG